MEGSSTSLRGFSITKRTPMSDRNDDDEDLDDKLAEDQVTHLDEGDDALEDEDDDLLDAEGPVEYDDEEEDETR
jgi:hypothetical protein